MSKLYEEWREQAVDRLMQIAKEGDHEVPGFTRVQDGKAQILPWQRAGTHGPIGESKFKRIVHPKVGWDELPKLPKRTAQQKRNDTWERIWKHYQLYGVTGLGKSIRDELEAHGIDTTKPMTADDFMAFATRVLHRAEKENEAQQGVVRVSPNTVTLQEPDVPGVATKFISTPRPLVQGPQVPVIRGGGS